MKQQITLEFTAGIEGSSFTAPFFTLVLRFGVTSCAPALLAEGFARAYGRRK